MNRYIQSLILNDENNEHRTQNTTPSKILCVSLGFNCITAVKLNQSQLRNLSFPFDWNISSLQGVCELIENNFKDFLNPVYLSKQNGIPGIVNSKYNVSLAHDFPEKDGVVADNYQDFLEEIQDRYQRRIKRFYNACNLAETVYFFRQTFSYWPLYSCPQDKEHVIKLRNILAKTFPTNNWVLVVISNAKEYLYDWQIPNVKNFYISSKETDNEWKEIFQKLKLIQ